MLSDLGLQAFVTTQTTSLIYDRVSEDGGFFVISVLVGISVGDQSGLS